MEILNNFIVFEGSDGSGTTTQLNILETFFHANHQTLPPFYKTAEPTKSSIGKLIRSSLQREIAFESQTIAMLFAADRYEHLYGPGGVVERCRRGELVVSDRYVPSSLVYQGITCGEELPASLNSQFPGPEILFYFDLDPKSAEKRMAGRPKKEIYETLDFQTQVCQRYKALLPVLSAGGIRIEVIDASPPPEDVAREVWRVLKNLPIING